MVSSIVELHQEYEPKGLVVIGIDTGEDLETVRAFVEANRIGHLNLLGNEKVMRDYELRAHPLTVLINGRGEIYRGRLGWVSKEVLEGDIQALLSSSPPSLRAYPKSRARCHLALRKVPQKRFFG